MSHTQPRHVPEWPAGRAHAHGVQFYELDAALCDSVAGYLATGLRAGEPAVAIVTGAHEREIRGRLAAAGLEPDGGMVTWLDAASTLDRLLVDGMPDRARFEEVIGGLIDEKSRGRLQVRAFGEMVDLLWRAGRTGAALRLEELWAELVERKGFSLLCAYVIDDFVKAAGGQAGYEAICAVHTHVLDPGGQTELELLRRRADALQAEVEHRQRLERALRDALAELRRSEAALQESRTEREQLIERLQESLRFSEMFVGILGHDLRNPLMAIGTAASLLERRVEGEKLVAPLRRIQSSAGRMSRMIDQILDFTRLRIGGGFPLRPRPLDLTAAVRTVLDELETAEPSSAFAMSVEGDVVGSWDEDRLCQLLSNLAGNALQHRTPGSGVRIHLDGREPDRVRIRLDNDGALSAELIPLIFEPFHGGPEKRSMQSSGLGLGLFISQQIALAHGGSIRLDPASGGGTCFVVDLPRHTPTAAPAPRDGR